MTRLILTAGVGLAAALASAGCYTMAPVELNELGAVTSARIWVTRADQSTVVVTGPRVLNDRLVGFVDRQYQEMPVADVTLVKAKRMAAGRTTAMVAAGLVGIGAVIAVVSGSGGSPDPCVGYTDDCPFPR